MKSLTTHAFHLSFAARLDVLMDAKRGDRSGSNYSNYESPPVYNVEEIRPHGGIKRFRSAGYSNVSFKQEAIMIHDLIASTSLFEFP